MASDNALDNPDSYTVAWIAALPIERAAAEAMLDDVHKAPTGFTRHQTDTNVYTWGRMGQHNIVIVSLAAGDYGTTSAATTASSLLASLPSIRVGLFVGIGGGIARPDKHRDIRLGDIVVSQPDGTSGGVCQYDLIKAKSGDKRERKGFLGRPPTVLLNALSHIKDVHEWEDSMVPSILQEVLRRRPRMGERSKQNPSYAHQGLNNDRLFRASYDHVPGPDCGGCDTAGEVQRAHRDSTDPEIHYGIIASGNTLVKDAAARDRIVADIGEDCICFEMEAAGLMNHFPCLVIRGICDYADSHKNDRWQRYASATAAAYAKELLVYMPAAEVQETKRALEVLQSDPSTNANNARKLRHEGTGAWLLGNPVFREWCSGSRRHLWLNGFAGCGKTVLSTTVLDHLMKGNDRLILSFFFDFSDNTKQTLDGMLRSLASQLYQGGAGSAGLLDASLQAHQDGRDQPATTTLEDVVCKMLAAQKKASIILDALDESTTRRKLLLWIKDIVSRPQLSDIQLICTARPETEFIREIPLLIGEENCLTLDKESVNADIRSYVAAQLSQRPDFRNKSLSPDLLEKIRIKVGDGADGMFRWASCQLESLAQCQSPADIEKDLASLPLNLKGPYQRIIESIPTELKNDAIRLLQFLVHLKRPLKLAEAREVMATQIAEETNLDSDDFETIVGLLGSLLTTRDGIINFVHWSVKEFLLEEYQIFPSDMKEMQQSSRKVKWSEPSVENANSIDRTEAATEWQTYDYPPSMTQVTATRSSGLSRDFWSSAYAQDTAIASTTHTSVDAVGKGKEPVLADTESVYTSDIPESLAYVQELATSFFKESELPDTESLDRVFAILPVLLRGFALRLGGEKQVSDHFEIMKFIHKKRRDIATCFEEYYLRDKDDVGSSQQRTLNGMSLGERLDRWQVDPAMDDPNSAKPPSMPDAPFLDDEIKLNDDDDGNEGNTNDDFPSTCRSIVTSSTAFRWLLCRVHRETILTSSEAGTMQAIATQIRQILYARRENCLISSKRGPPMCSMVFQSDWDPLAFVCEQEYAEEAEDAVEGAIVIVQGVNRDAEAMPCSEYLSRTWPLFGEDFMRLVKHVVRSIRGLRCSVTLFDKTKLTAWIEPSGHFFLEATGVAETIVEVGEVYGWMIAALRSGPGDAVTSVIPALESDANNFEPTFRVNFRLQFSHSPLRVAGQCWQDLFRNPAVVLGYPVRRRQPGQEPGLESSLYTLAALVGTRRIAVFCGKMFLKGFCTMLVPTKYTGDTVHWHVLFNEDGCRIPFTDFRVRDVAGEFDISEHLMLSGIETARHVVGWCEKVRNYAGSKEANYDIDKSGLRWPDSGFAFDRISISAGKIVTVGASVALGKKDKPARAAKSSDYHKQLEWIDQRFVVLFDPKDRRAWLIDGLSALLHFVRASLVHRRRLGREVLFGEGDVKEPDTPHTGKAAANEVLRNRANMDLKIYEKWNRLVEETSKMGERPSETTQKTQKTWEQLPDLVGDIYTTLSMIVDIQTDVRTADGFGAKVRMSPRRRLEGWDFQQLATGADPLWPRATMLRHTGLGWVDLVRGINAITFFGVGFGEILEPIAVTRGGIICGEGDAAVPGSAGDPRGEATLCAKWARLPRGEDLLATTTPVIRDMMGNLYRDTDYNGRFWELFESIYWHSPDKIFENCACAADKTQCDRVQVLLPTQFPSLFARSFRSPPKPLPNHGAVIFGHSVKFPLIWKSEAGSVPSEGQPPKPQLASSSSHQSDSGLGTSVASSDQGNSSSQAPNQRPSGNGSTHGEPLSLAPSTVSADTRSHAGKGSRNVLGRLLGQIRSGTKPS
ncbi:hypothetical protein MHUMG1_06646 [Metarhizium humberi]|uniref:NACHT domain-containing protein n=1 Tax=Metarhizium humberi TaxID=2596975 RepID=A0A9P8S5C2_9HYPO|nr:hypothetical protein MHUMG1_06646 [Metarhizium humberi]